MTDHDNIDGLEFVERECKKSGIKHIPGIEFTTNFAPLNLETHILGYGFDANDAFFQKKLDLTKKRAWKFADQICEILSDHDWIVDYSHLESTKGIITKHDITIAIQNRDTSVYDFHEKWLTNKSKFYKDIEKFTVEEAINIIHRAGGKAICAHLVRTLENNNSLTLLPDIADYLVKCGIDGFEVFYGKNNYKKVKVMYDICNSYSVLMTGGSDYHGPGRNGRCPMGDYNVHNFSYNQTAVLGSLDKTCCLEMPIIS